MKRAYSLIRFSSWKQAQGQSRRRQAEWSAAWCERNNYLLDESLKWDKPVSAFRGANRSKGALAAFLEMIQVGRVAKGSVLLLESLDRLSREQVDEAFVLFQGILKAGVEIVTMSPERRYTKASIGDIVGILEPLVIMARANEESAIKSERIADVWKKRREKAAEKPMNGVGPAWLRLSGGRWEPVPAKVAAVRRVFRLAIDGHGLHAIAATLNQEKVPAIGKAGHWVYSYVGKTLRNRAVLGELEPHVIRDGKRVPTGKPIAGYYPPVIDEATFYQAAAALDARKNQKGPRGKHVRNLFTGLIRDASDGCSMVTVTESTKCKNVRLVSSGAQRGHAGSSYRTFPYPAVEEAVLKKMKELKASDVLPADRGDAPDDVAALSGRLQELEHQAARLAAEMKAGGDFDLGLRLLRDIDAEKKATAARLEKAKAEQSTSEVEILGETQSLIDLMAGVKGKELAELRTKIKARIRQLVSEIVMLIIPHAGDRSPEKSRRRVRDPGRVRARLAVLQIWFAEGAGHRDILIRHRPRLPPQYLSFPAPASGPLDLRRTDDVRRLELALATLPLG